MKKFIILVSALALLLPAQTFAQEAGKVQEQPRLQVGEQPPVQDSPEAGSLRFSMAAGASLGVMDGAGVALGFGVTDRFKVRAGFGLIPSFLIKEYIVSLPKWGSNPATTTGVSGMLPSSGSLLLDFHPGGKSFHLTAGVFFGSSDFARVYNTKALPESYHNFGVAYHADGDMSSSKFYTIQPDDKGFLYGALKSGAVRPFAGLGFGSAIPRKRVGVTFDLGVEYTGGLELRTDALNLNGDVVNIPITTAGVLKTVYEMRGSSEPKFYDKYFDYIDKIRELPILPVARISVFVKLF